MDALEAKTCENRRFWGRFQKNLIVWKPVSTITKDTAPFEFQKNLIVWKHLCYLGFKQGVE